MSGPARGLHALAREKAVDGFTMYAQNTPDSDGVEPSVVNQPPNRLGMDAELVGNFTNADETVRLLLRRCHCVSTYNSSRRIA